MCGAIYLAFLAFLFCWGNVSAQTCVIETSNGAFEISAQTFTEITERGTMYVNLCENVQGICQNDNPPGYECAVCQGGTPGSPHIELCLGYANGLTYWPLSADYGSVPGFRVNMTGPQIGCGTINRQIQVDVLCAQPADEFRFLRDVGCTYSYQLKLHSCTPSSGIFLVSYQINRRSSNSFMIEFIEPYQWMDWTYHVYIDNVKHYEGPPSTLPIDNLESGTPYMVSVYKSTDPGSFMTVTTPWNNETILTLGTPRVTPSPKPTPGGSSGSSPVTPAGFFTGSVVTLAIVGLAFGGYTFYKRKYQNRRGGAGFGALTGAEGGDDEDLAF